MFEISIFQSLILILIGVVAGFLNVMAGGGSLLTVPVLIFMGLPGVVANGTNRIAIIAQNITAVIAFHRKGLSDYKLGLSLAACAIPGAIFGAWVGTQLHGVWFNRVLALVMIGVMVVMGLTSGSKPPVPDQTDIKIKAPDRKQLIVGHILVIGAGMYGGFIQIGIGFIMIAILHHILGIDLVRANMYKVLIALCYTVPALFVFMSQVQLVWIAGISLALGNAVGGWFGTHFSITRGERLIRKVLYVVLTVLIIKLLFE